MANFLFWLFTLAAALLIPACMLYLGRRFQTRPPRNINMGYGYRSHRSMQSQEAWDFAQVYSGRFWVRAGRPVLAVSLVWMALLFGREADTVAHLGLLLTGLQMVPFLAVIPATERVLRRKFG